MAVLHLETLSGVAKGLTRINEDVFGTDDNPVVKKELEKIQNARGSTDAGISHALSDLFKSITCLPHDITL
ncbi:hypothetical protein JOM56_014641, partial [Amanita muscaria]